MVTTNFSISIHRPKSVRMTAHISDNTRWIFVELGDHEITLFFDSQEAFESACEQYNIPGILEVVR